MKKEKDLYSFLKRKLEKWCHITRIESAVGIGIPDMNLGHGGRDCWLELKFVDRPLPQVGTKFKFPLIIKWNTTQALWALKRTAFGSKVFLVVGFNDGGITVFDTRLLLLDLTIKRVAGDRLELSLAEYNRRVNLIISQKDFSAEKFLKALVPK